MRASVVHELKTWPPYYDAIERGDKPFEIRENDRGFQTGDILHLFEWDPNAREFAWSGPGKYTGRSSRWEVTYLIHGEMLGVKDGYCVMGIKRVESEANQ